MDYRPKIKRPPKPKADRRGRPRAVETVRVMSITNSDRDDLETLRFVLSFDIVERLLQLRDRDDTAKLGPNNWSWLRADFLSFDDRALPCTFMRLAPGDLHQSQLANYPKLLKDPKGHQFKVQIRADKLGVHRGVITQRLETLWLEDERYPRGLLILFNDDDMVYTGQKKRVADILQTKPATKGMTP